MARTFGIFFVLSLVLCASASVAKSPKPAPSPKPMPSPKPAPSPKPSPAACVTCARSIVALGDSVIDGGLPNGLWALDGQTYPFAKFGYYKGHFSNGLTWIEELAQAFRLPLGNYAIGGASVNPVDTFPTLAQQVGPAVAWVKANATAPAVGVISIGGNDILYLEYEPFSSNTSAVLQWASNAINGTIQAATALLSTGMVSQIVIAPTWATIHDTPNFLATTPLQQAQINILISYMNAGLNTSINAFNKELNRSALIYLDASALLDRIVKNPKTYALKNVTAPCVVFNPPGSGLVYSDNGTTIGIAKLVSTCKQPNDYFFWDMEHPTSAGHRLIAKYVATVLRTYNALPKTNS